MNVPLFCMSKIVIVIHKIISVQNSNSLSFVIFLLSWSKNKRKKDFLIKNNVSSLFLTKVILSFIFTREPNL